MRLVRLFTIACLLLTPLFVRAQRERIPPEDLEIVEKSWPNAKRTSTGLRTEVLKPGTGPTVKKGDLVSVYYTGKLLDGKIFDQALPPAKPFTFRVGRNVVIEGWDQGLQLMSLGERRLLIVPYELGYGSRGSLPKIPKRATLVFEVEVFAINPTDVAETKAPKS